ncbi:MAG: IMP cyclohydrolase [Desulfovibrionaceae bacterium]|nr:IMP cyclohydrolase [Desulfovibrionaceae bacterium]
MPENLKAMYSTVVQDAFPDTVTMTIGDKQLIYKKREWTIDQEKKGLRYGENPDQPAALYQLIEGSLEIGGIKFRTPNAALISAMDDGEMLQAGKHPGKTNLTDVDNGANILQYLTDRPCAVIIKHNNPCGCAWSTSGIAQALDAAFWCDRIAAFGGAIVINRPLTLDAAKLISANYFEVVAAPSYEARTIELLQGRKNLRILELPGLGHLEDLRLSAFLDIKSLADGGLIIQKSFTNRILTNADFYQAQASTKEGLKVSARMPTDQELDDLRFAWAVEAGVTSNSVIFAKDGMTCAIGTGEQDRVGCVELACHKAYTKYADKLAFTELGLSLYELKEKAKDDAGFAAKLEKIQADTASVCGGLTGSRLVSDGFFPFRDGVDVAIRHGVTAIAQPGGAIRDAEVIMACNEATPQVGMVFTAQRSFKH